jgi:predicted transglutaminase-like cysteine proteinase
MLAALLLAAAGTASVDARRKVEPAEPRFAAPAALFGMLAVEHPPARNFAKWNDALARYEAERRIERQLCERGDCALAKWRRVLAELRRADAMAQLRAVNAYINRVPYKTDEELYGVEDYWATPRELFAKGGDCEDYAIAKYLSLRALGWPAERLRIVVVHDRARDLVHAALVAYHGGRAYLLDIEIAEVTDVADVERYSPIFAISEEGWWSFRAGETVVTRSDETRPDAAEKPPAGPDTAATPPAKAEAPAKAAAKSEAATRPVARPEIEAKPPSRPEAGEKHEAAVKPPAKPEIAVKVLARTAATAEVKAAVAGPAAARHAAKRPRGGLVRSVPTYRPPQTAKPAATRPAQSQADDEDDEDEKENTPPPPEPGERLQEVFLPAAQ